MGAHMDDGARHVPPHIKSGQDMDLADVTIAGRDDR